MIVPVVLAGGSGTRLWPLSRQLFPKQLLKLTNSYTMLQNTILRLSGAGDMAQPILICNEKHRLDVSAQLSEIGIAPSAVFLEPVGRNTAPAVAVAALEAIAMDPEALILILPADHLISDREKFHEIVNAGAALAARGFLITFGVVPDKPETGYGYIRKGPAVNGAGEGSPSGRAAACVIDEFVEKPDLDTARAYLDSGNYCWNSGMFMFGAKTVLDEMNRLVPGIVHAAAAAVQKARPQGDARLLDHAEFAACPSDSIDYAVMEKTERGVMIPFDAGWDDLGSWAAIWDVGEKDASGNLIAGDVMTKGVSDSLIFSRSRLVAGVGLSRQLVVESPDAVLVASMEKAQDVKHIVDQLKSEGRREASAHTVVHLPWGQIQELEPEPEPDSGMGIRKLRLGAGRHLGFSGHGRRSLCWVVCSGAGLLFINGEKQPVSPADMFRLDPEARVRLENPGPEPVIVLELAANNDDAADHLMTV